MTVRSVRPATAVPTGQVHSDEAGPGQLPELLGRWLSRRRDTLELIRSHLHDMGEAVARNSRFFIARQQQHRRKGVQRKYL